MISIWQNLPVNRHQIVWPLFAVNLPLIGNRMSVSSR